MKNLVLTLIIVASLQLNAQTSTEVTPLLIHSASLTGLSLTQKKALSLTNISKKETSELSNPQIKKPKVTPTEKVNEDYPLNNKFKAFIGFGNTNPVADYVTLTDKSFIGELGWQVRGGIRLYQNYELNVGIYGRSLPDASKYEQLSYNKFLGYSVAIVHEYKIPGVKRLGVPFGFEVLKYKRECSFTMEEGVPYTETYEATAYGPKIGLRYHFSKSYFIETELEVQYEQFKSNIDWVEKSNLEANKIGTFKFFGITLNKSF